MPGAYKKRESEQVSLTHARPRTVLFMGWQRFLCVSFMTTPYKNRDIFQTKETAGNVRGIFSIFSSPGGPFQSTQKQINRVMGITI